MTGFALAGGGAGRIGRIGTVARGRVYHRVRSRAGTDCEMERGSAAMTRVGPGGRRPTGFRRRLARRGPRPRGPAPAGSGNLAGPRTRKPGRGA